MTDLNNIVLIGRLTQTLGQDERSFGYIGSGQARANVSIAVNRSKKAGDQWVEEVNYFNITIWGRTAENLKPYLTKGKRIGVQGHLKQDRWEKDGQKFSRISIIADSVWLLDSSSQQPAAAGGNTGNQFRPIPPAPQQPDYYQQDFDGEGFPEDIPF